MKPQLQWIAATPDSTLSFEKRLELSAGLHRDGFSVETVAIMQPHELAKLVERFLGQPAQIMGDFARTVIEFLGEQITLAATPPTATKLEEFIQECGLRQVASATLSSVYASLTSNSSMTAATLIDPRTSQPFSPVMLQRAIEKILDLPAR